MYNENGRSYFFRDLIVKILLVLLFIFLLMWLFPMPNLNPFYDKIFTQNMNSMTDAARSFYTVARLPQKEGETSKLTLGDMISNKMLIEFTDSNGKTCDKDKSYVEVTKKGNEYIFKTNLSCSTGEDYVIEYFGCYNVCENGSCTTVIDKVDNNSNNDNNSNSNNNNNNGSEEVVINGNGGKGTTTNTKKITEYQFSKTTKTDYISKYTCKNGYTLKGDKCLKESEVTKTEDASMKCSTGYSYNSNTKKCEKLVSEELDATLSCPQGYIYATSTKECIKSTEDSVDATLTYKCNEGTLLGTKCIINNKVTEDAKVEYSCKSGTLSGTKCIVGGSSTVDATKVYTCDAGTLSGTKCINVPTTTTTSAQISSYRCSSGTLSGTKCVISNPQNCGYSDWVCSNRTYATSMSTSSTATFTRRFLYQIGTSRVYEECNRTYSCSGGGSYTVDATPVYSCSKGTLSGTSCVNVPTTTTTDAKLSYKCTNGTLNGTKCDVSTSDTIDATKSYKCTNGTLNGTKCEYTKTSEKDATKVYTCSAGTLNGTKCDIKNVNGTKPVYTCKYGTLNSSTNKCVVTTTDSKNPIYYCKSGYTLADKKCYITENASDIVNATPVYDTKTDTVYTWSTKTSLIGWTRTGKTRVREVAITSRF